MGYEPLRFAGMVHGRAESSMGFICQHRLLKDEEQFKVSLNLHCPLALADETFIAQISHNEDTMRLWKNKNRGKHICEDQRICGHVMGKSKTKPGQNGRHN